MQVSGDACLKSQRCERWVQEEKRVLGWSDVFRRTRLLAMAAALYPRLPRGARLILPPLGAGFAATAKADQGSCPTRLWDMANPDPKHAVLARKYAESQKLLFFVQWVCRG